MPDLPTSFPAIPNPTPDPAALFKTVERLKEVTEMVTGQRNPNVPGITQKIFSIESSLGANLARIEQVDEVSATATEAIARRTTDIEASVNALDQGLADTNAEIKRVEEAYASADQAIAQTVTTLTATVETNRTDAAATILAVDTARADGDSALAQSVETLGATFQTNLDGVSSAVNARVDGVAQAYADADGALASQIQTVSASIGNNFALGRLAFRAEAGLNGVSASYHLVLTAQATGGPERSTGLYAVLNTDGSSATAFSTDAFRLYDPSNGGTRAVFDYADGQFVLNGNVTINGSLIVNGSVATGAVALNAITSIWSGTSGGGSLTVPITTTGGMVICLANFNGDPGTTNLAGAGAFQLLFDGTAVAAVPNNFNSNGNGVNILSRAMFVPLAPTPGAHAIQIVDDKPGGLQLIILEVKR